MFKTLLLSLLFLIKITSAVSAEESSFKVVFLNPGHAKENSTGSFWPNVSLFMDAAAKDLNIELITLYAERNHIVMKSLATKILAHDPKYIILVNEKGMALNLIKELSPHNIPVFMLLNSFSEQELSLLNKQEQSIIKGSLVPNNYLAGKRLTDGLLDIYYAPSNKEKHRPSPNLLALTGDYSTPAALEREQGLLDAIKTRPTINILDKTAANWSKEQAYNKVKGILHHARIDIIWAANDAMAFGAKKAVMESALSNPVIIGGVNWDIDDIDYPVNLSFGGHVTLGALSLVMLKDIEQNNLPVAQRFKVIDIFESSLHTTFTPFTKYLQLKKINNFNFSRFSQSSTQRLNVTIEGLIQSYQED
ncbi:hypothetical protein GCM10009111_27550 [Colwellia asteriadis]|uniref:Periplasmic binding protein domain-containing protein n=1 Tax=Colwellia asteriadis TaxID=517723 RepID=A0ABN1L9Z2_9GAMM